MSYGQWSKEQLIDRLWDPKLSKEERITIGKQVIQDHGGVLTYFEKMDVYGKMGQLYLETSNTKAGLKCNKMLRQFTEESGNSTERAEALYYVGIAYLKAGFPDSARSVLRTALDSLQRNENPLCGTTLINLAIANSDLGDYSQAIRDNINALRVLKGQKDTIDMLSGVMGLGLIHLATKDYDKALVSFRNSLRLARLIRNSRTTCKSLNNIALAHLRLQNADSALIILRSVANRYGSDDEVSKSSLFHTFVQMAEAHEKLGRLDSAMMRFYKAAHLQSIIDDKSASAELWGKMARLYMGSAPNNDSARHYAQKTLDLAELTGIKAEKLKASEMLFRLTLNATEDQTSLNYLEDLMTLQEEIYGEETIKAVQNANAAFETEKKQQQIEHLNTENTLKDKLVKKGKQNVVILIVALALLLALSVIIVLNQSNKRKAKEELLKEQEKAFEAEMKALRKQQELSTFQARVQAQEKERNRISRELHDGITPALAAAKLNASSGKIDSEFIASLTKITDDLRNLSHQLAPVALDFQSLEESMAHFLSNFHGINGLLIDLTFPPEGLPYFSPEVQISLYRSVQELMTNINKHSKATEARFDFETDAEYCTLQVADNGVGFNGETTTNGLGLSSIQQRVEEFGGRLTISPNQGIGTQVYIEIPLPN